MTSTATSRASSPPPIFSRRSSAPSAPIPAPPPRRCGARTGAGSSTATWRPTRWPTSLASSCRRSANTTPSPASCSRRSAAFRRPAIMWWRRTGASRSSTWMGGASTRCWPRACPPAAPPRQRRDERTEASSLPRLRHLGRRRCRHHFLQGLFARPRDRRAGQARDRGVIRSRVSRRRRALQSRGSARRLTLLLPHALVPASVRRQRRGGDALSRRGRGHHARGRRRQWPLRAGDAAPARHNRERRSREGEGAPRTSALQLLRRQLGEFSGGRGAGDRSRRLEHHHPRSDRRAQVKVGHFLVQQADAARRYVLADGPWLARAVDAVECVFVADEEVERPRAERIVRAAGHALGQFRLAQQHFLRRNPVGPFGLAADVGGAAPREALAADADAVTDRRVALAQEVEKMVLGVDHERARLLAVSERHELTAECGIEFLEGDLADLELTGGDRADVPLVLGLGLFLLRVRLLLVRQGL